MVDKQETDGGSFYFAHTKGPFLMNDLITIAEHIIDSVELHQKSAHKISVIVPIGGFPNGIQQLKEWLNSGTSREIEVILVIDSNDLNIQMEIDSLAKSLTEISIHVLSSSARNPGTARNIGLEKATSDWVCFWDSDDIGLVSQILSDVELGEKLQVDLVIGRYTQVSVNQKNEVTSESISPEATPEEIYLNPGLWRMVIRRTLIAQLRFPGLKMAEDQIFVFGLLQKKPKIRFLDSVSYRYFKYPANQLTRSKDALDDLPAAIRYSSKMFGSEPNRLLAIGIIKQFFSALKYCSTIKKFVASREILKLSLLHPKFVIYCLANTSITLRKK